MGLLVGTLSVLRPDVDRMREEPSPHTVIRRANEMGRRVAKWLPGALILTLMHAVIQGSTHTPLHAVRAGSNALLFYLFLRFTTD